MPVKYKERMEGPFILRLDLNHFLIGKIRMPENLRFERQLARARFLTFRLGWRKDAEENTLSLDSLSVFHGCYRLFSYSNSLLDVCLNVSHQVFYWKKLSYNLNITMRIVNSTIWYGKWPISNNFVTPLKHYEHSKLYTGGSQLLTGWVTASSTYYTVTSFQNS